MSKVSIKIKRNILVIVYICIFFVLGFDVVKSFKREKKAKVVSAFSTNNHIVLEGEILQTFEMEEEYSAETVYVNDSNLYVGEEVTIREGKNGIKKEIQFQTHYNGDLVDVITIETEIVELALPKVVAVGVKERPKYIIPVENYTVSSRFGRRWGRNHNGIDFAVCEGNIVRAAADGTCTFVGTMDGYGKCIFITHEDGDVTIYGHLSEFLEGEGACVKQGDPIAKSGNTGRSTGPHLHFEIREEGTPINPEEYLEDLSL